MNEIVEQKSLKLSRPFELFSGKVLPEVEVAYETYGKLNENKDNVILILHALTGSAHVAGYHHPDDKYPGWWDGLIGNGMALDPAKYFIICTNVIGGCYGTTGPKSTNPLTGKPYAMNFPVVTVRDMVRLQKLFLKEIGINKIKLAIGGSLGGMQALEWATTYPNIVENIVSIAATGKLSTQGIAFDYIQRRAIEDDPLWQDGNYYPGRGPEKGLALARMIGIITYKSEESWKTKFGRVFAGQNYLDYKGRFEIENYLDYQGRKLVERFDANSYLYLLKAMDLHDLGFGYKSYVEALRRIISKVLIIGINSDLLYPPWLQYQLVEELSANKVNVVYKEINSPHGHDAFLIEFDKLNAILADFMTNLC